MKEKAKYYQLFEQLKKDIFQGVYQNGQRLPGENEMAQEFSMSRQTVRQALALLEQEHLIQRRQGSGTYVHRPYPGPNTAGTWASLPPTSASTSFPPSSGALKGNFPKRGSSPCFPPPRTGWTTNAAAGGIHRQKSGRPHCGGHQKRPAQPQFAPV